MFLAVCELPFAFLSSVNAAVFFQAYNYKNFVSCLCRLLDEFSLKSRLQNSRFLILSCFEATSRLECQSRDTRDGVMWRTLKVSFPVLPLTG